MEIYRQKHTFVLVRLEMLTNCSEVENDSSKFNLMVKDIQRKCIEEKLLFSTLTIV